MSDKVSTMWIMNSFRYIQSFKQTFNVVKEHVEYELTISDAALEKNVLRQGSVDFNLA